MNWRDSINYTKLNKSPKHEPQLNQAIRNTVNNQRKAVTSGEQFTIYICIFMHYASLVFFNCVTPFFRNMTTIGLNNFTLGSDPELFFLFLDTVILLPNIRALQALPKLTSCRYAKDTPDQV